MNFICIAGLVRARPGAPSIAPITAIVFAPAAGARAHALSRPPTATSKLPAPGKTSTSEKIRFILACFHEKSPEVTQILDEPGSGRLPLIPELKSGIAARRRRIYIHRGKEPAIAEAEGGYLQRRNIFISGTIISMSLFCNGGKICRTRNIGTAAGGGIGDRKRNGKQNQEWDYIKNRKQTEIKNEIGVNNEYRDGSELKT
ncbi:hypothetical protein EVAR_75849_1 [Eumeta japonica]|uniref:Uncharacterized protein n=1 Tax=Eumeta variegata TaxID=151549 RepID=A0A4C1TG67_EUMVA|nr:hypothetical protein EVAR_75849_1 [Eumeta japonica]